MLDTGEAAVLRSFLQVLDNPLQDIPLEAVLASPVFRFTADHLGRIRAACPDGPLFEALSQAAEAGDSQSGAFLELVQSLRQGGPVGESDPASGGGVRQDPYGGGLCRHGRGRQAPPKSGVSL